MARDRTVVRRFVVFCTAWHIFAATSIGVGNTATKEEVDRCRAIEQRAERVACFDGLKQNKSTKTDGAAPTKTEDTPSTKRQDTIPLMSNTGPNSRPDKPANMSTINDLVGRPICVDSNGLAAVLMAGLLTADPAQAVLPGCQMIPADAKVEILERYRGVYDFMHLIRVKVTSRTKPHLTDGITVEVVPFANEGSLVKLPAGSVR
jgi:hypothetical protein